LLKIAADTNGIYMFYKQICWYMNTHSHIHIHILDTSVFVHSCLLLNSILNNKSILPFNLDFLITSYDRLYMYVIIYIIYVHVYANYKDN